MTSLDGSLIAGVDYQLATVVSLAVDGEVITNYKLFLVVAAAVVGEGASVAEDELYFASGSGVEIKPYLVVGDVAVDDDHILIQHYPSIAVRRLAASEGVVVGDGHGLAVLVDVRHGWVLRPRRHRREHHYCERHRRPPCDCAAQTLGRVRE